jgi:xanthine/uracil permease
VSWRTLRRQWGLLLEHLLAPANLLGLVVAMLGQVQAMTEEILKHLPPAVAGHVLSLVGILIIAARYVQAVPAKPPSRRDDGEPK